MARIHPKNGIKLTSTPQVYHPGSLSTLVTKYTLPIGIHASQAFFVFVLLAIAINAKADQTYIASITAKNKKATPARSPTIPLKPATLLYPPNMYATSLIVVLLYFKQK